ncbi:TetR/AcrR family transcriptional regulator [Nocardioides convexus]|uniref:TetR/AcrR family transcriptional regulator n=1 Tax=Nocardioides convexus TaxID=2712224 RepID=UPI0024189CE3|nr:TetR/AcrR family transcriptional regulator [Nocardioides convexus]
MATNAPAGKAPATDGRRKAAAARRRARQADIIAATRQIFDSKGVRDVQIEEVATAVGINRAIVYRHFTGKEELFALTLVGYLEEPARGHVGGGGGDRRAGRADWRPSSAPSSTTASRTRPSSTARRRSWSDPARSLLDEIAEGPLFRLGRGITSCLTVLSDTLAEGVEKGAFTLSDDPVLLANALYASGLGALQPGPARHPGQRAWRPASPRSGRSRRSRCATTW